MARLRTYYPAIIAAITLCIVVLLLYPSCHDFIDPDATAYLTISKRYANGDYLQAINGYWSPWSCWLVALLIKLGWAAFEAALLANTIAAIGVLLIMQSFALAFRLHSRLQWFMCLSLAAFLGYAVYKQLFDDLWQCFFLLLSLRILTLKNYNDSARLWILNGVVGGFAYFSKAYALPFFALNTAGCCFLILQAQSNFTLARWARMSAIPVIVMVICGSPWMYALYIKYGEVMSATAGKLNLSWYLVGHPIFADGIDVLLPPPYQDSPYYWEDPYIVNGATPHFYSSAKLFVLQMVKVGYNFLKFINCINELSAFYLFTWLVAIYILFSKKRMLFADRKSKLIAFSFLLFPLGFILINYESRYIWYTTLLSMLIGMLAIQKLVTMFNITRRMAVFLTSIFAASYVFWPAWDTRSMAVYGNEAETIATVIKKEGLKGSFAINTNDISQVRVATQVAYHTGNAYYNMPFNNAFPAILKDMRRYKVKYYFYHYSLTDQDAKYSNFKLLDEQGNPFKELDILRQNGWKIFVINP